MRWRKSTMKRNYLRQLFVLLALTASLLSAGCSDDSGEDQAAENGQEATETLKVGMLGKDIKTACIILPTVWATLKKKGRRAV